MHRFIPSLLMARGARIRQIPVHHRPRAGGTSKYSNWGRLGKAFRDLFGVRWLKSRLRRINCEELAL
jgi:dolichol-phosphate mannosyltransferase